MYVGDSSYFVALADRRDRWHREARRVKGDLRGGFVISELVLAEAVTLIGKRQGGRPAQVLYQYFIDDCELELASSASLGEAMAYHLQYDGNLSVTDCLNLVIMSERSIGDIVSFDNDYDRVRGLNRIH